MNRLNPIDAAWTLRVFLLGGVLLSFISGADGSIGDICYSATTHAIPAVAVFRADIASLLFIPLLIISAPLDTAFAILLPLLILMALVANTQPLRRVAGLATAAVAWLAVELGFGQLDFSANITPLFLISVGITLQGVLLRLSILQRRKQQHELAEAMKRAEAASAGERRRLAGELHDIVAHDLTVLTMLSTMGQTLDDTEKIKDHLSRMELTSRSALADLRRLLGALERTEVPPVSLGTSTTRPDIRAVVDSGIEELTRLNFPTSLTCRGELDSIPRSVQHALRRSINEMFANVTKYAEPGSPVDIVLVLTTDGVTLRITNVPSPIDRRTDSGGMGLGLSHLQEQAESFNGSFQAGLEGHRWISELYIPLQPNETDDGRQSSPR
ncbi:sensor histidine kinase [Austwickia sp. TVS 96-490-7B]|uniref:sensor histidine kinase n=1 Tax=Austwickia sp. TVS 96-490-7B TaxID=2830843 RepID=UPI001C59E2AD|nr:histidine kinase [Austwickia sp. TVS 96-490-7B]